ncbi:MAG TPA: hypothetical protein VFR81_22030 [Longimicrobium sp.]|nr:hypothetical protein [Longimicrobium sp.]
MESDGARTRGTSVSGRSISTGSWVTIGTTALSTQEPNRCRGSAVSTSAPVRSIAASVRRRASGWTVTSASQKTSTSPLAASAS